MLGITQLLLVDCALEAHRKCRVDVSGFIFLNPTGSMVSCQESRGAEKNEQLMRWIPLVGP